MRATETQEYSKQECGLFLAGTLQPIGSRCNGNPPGRAIVRYSESFRWAYLIGAVLAVILRRNSNWKRCLSCFVGSPTMWLFGSPLACLESRPHKKSDWSIAIEVSNLSRVDWVGKYLIHRNQLRPTVTRTEGRNLPKPTR